jgi:ferredoxin
MIKDYAKEIGLDDIGIASIDSFKNAPALMDPKNIFPEAKSVIVTIMRIPRGTYRGIEEGTHWHNYTYYSYNRLNTFFRPRLTYKMACFVENFGFEAAPHYPGVPERNPTVAPVIPGRMPANVTANIRLMGVGAGIGEMGHSKVFLNPKFGPRVRLGCILTDAELEPDPIIDPGTLCNKCGKCVRECPGCAIPPVKDKDKLLHVDIGGKDIYWGDVHMGRCTLTHHGLNNMISPFLKRDFPNLEIDVPNTDITEEEAYRLCYPLSSSIWNKSLYDNPDGAIFEYYHYIRRHIEYFAICGARGCIRACMDNLERTKRIENIFHNKFYKKPSWILPIKMDKKQGVINPNREKWLDENYPEIRVGEQKEQLFK